MCTVLHGSVQSASLDHHDYHQLHHHHDRNHRHQPRHGGDAGGGIGYDEDDGGEKCTESRDHCDDAASVAASDDDDGDGHDDDADDDDDTQEDDTNDDGAFLDADDSGHDVGAPILSIPRQNRCCSQRFRVTLPWYLGVRSVCHKEWRFRGSESGAPSNFSFKSSGCGASTTSEIRIECREGGGHGKRSQKHWQAADDLSKINERDLPDLSFVHQKNGSVLQTVRLDLL